LQRRPTSLLRARAAQQRPLIRVWPLARLCVRTPSASGIEDPPWRGGASVPVMKHSSRRGVRGGCLVSRSGPPHLTPPHPGFPDARVKSGKESELWTLSEPEVRCHRAAQQRRKEAFTVRDDGQRPEALRKGLDGVPERLRSRSWRSPAATAAGLGLIAMSGGGRTWTTRATPTCSVLTARVASSIATRTRTSDCERSAPPRRTVRGRLAHARLAPHRGLLSPGSERSCGITKDEIPADL
jgi:hypothetical protein